MSFVSDLVERLYQSGLWDSSFKNLYEGCSVQDLERLQLEQAVPSLPLIYKDFMLTMGNHCQALFPSDAMWQCHIVGINKEIALERLKESGAVWQLPHTAFVFYFLDPFELCYFLADGSDDNPAVYQFYDGISGTKKISDRLSDYYFYAVDRRLKEKEAVRKHDEQKRP